MEEQQKKVKPTKDNQIKELKRHILQIETEADILAFNNINLLNYIIAYIDSRFAELSCIHQEIPEEDPIKNYDTGIIRCKTR